MIRPFFRAAAVAAVVALVVVPVALADGPYGNPDPNPNPGPTAQEAAALAQKQQVATDYVLARKGLFPVAAAKAEMATIAGATAVVSPMASAGGVLGMSQFPQQYNYYCGASASYSILRYRGATTGPRGESLSQTHLAAYCTTGYLCTEADQGTPWYQSAAYPHPVPSTLNTWAHSTWYMAQDGATNFSTNLTFDIDNGYPLALNVYEKASSSTPHLVGHPTNIEIYHWVAASGYGSYGATTYYADPVHGSSVSWAGSVPAYSYIASGSTGMSYMLATRGFVW
ncbi:MAG TPA: C39 family peptidase [Candidatus Limnocylindrales bacterium]